MAGYAIECSLKAYLQREGKPFPTSGSEGHNLKKRAQELTGWIQNQIRRRSIHRRKKP